MPRRASLPGADLLFGSPAQQRPAPTADPVSELPPTRPVEAPQAHTASLQPGPADQVRSGSPRAGTSDATTRPRHDEKVTFYCTASDLTRLEAARLDLRANHRISSDRGRIVRAAIAEILDDFDARGADSLLVKRLDSE